MWCCSEGCRVNVAWWVCGWRDKQMICATQWKKDGEIRGRRVDLSRTCCISCRHRLWARYFDWFPIFARRWLRHPLQTLNPSDPMVSGLVGALFNSDRTGKQWCNSDNRDDTPAFIRLWIHNMAAGPVGLLFISIPTRPLRPGPSLWEHTGERPAPRGA